MTSKRQKQRRRPGRFRRWLLRPAVWILAGVAVLFALAVLYLDSASFADRLRRTAERRLTASLGRETTIGAVELDLVPLTVTVTDFAIAGPVAGSPPLASFERAVVEAEPGALFGRRLDLRHVFVRRPRLRIGFDEEGKADLPRLGGAGGGEGSGPLEMRFGTLEVEGGELVLDDDRTPLDFAARDLEAVFAGVGDGLELRGRAESDLFDLLLPRGNPYQGRLEVHGVIRPHRFDIVRAEVAGPDLSARVDGYWRWYGDREVALGLEAAGDLGALGRLGYLDGQLAGAFELGGDLTVKPGAWWVDAEVRSPAATVFERRLTGLATRVHADAGRMTIDIDRAVHGGGAVTGSVALGIAADPGRVDLELELDRVALGRLTGDLGIPIEGLGGGVSGVFHYQFDSAAPQAGNGWADLVVADERSPDPTDTPVGGSIPLTIGGGVVRSQAIRLAAPGFRVTAGGAFDLASATGGYDFELDADRVADVMKLVPGGGEEEEGAAAAWRPTAGSGRASGRLDLGPAGAALRLLLELEAVEATGLAADRVTGVVALDAGGVREMRLEASRPDAALIVSGAIPFDGAPPGVEVFPFALALDAAGWPLSSARAWLPFELPVDGPFTGTVELAPDAAVEGALAGRFAGRLAPVRLGERAAESLDVDAAFDAAELTVAAADLALAGGVVTATGTVGWDELELDLEVASTPLDLAALSGLDRGLEDLAARLDGRVTGRLAEPDLAARLEWVSFDPAVAVTDTIDLGWSGGRLRVDGSLPGLVEIAGGGVLAAGGVDLEIALNDGRVERLLRLAQADTGIVGGFDGRLTVTGHYDPDLDLETTLVLDRLTARLETGGDGAVQPVLRNLEPVVVEIDGEGLRLRSLYLGDAAGTSEVFVGGRIAAGGALDLQLQTTVAADWLGVLVARFWPGARWSGGAFDAIATVGGDTSLPRVNGVGEVRGARLVADGLPAAIEDLNGTVLFSRDQIVIDSVTARAAGGTLKAGGTVPLGGDAARPMRFQAVGESLSYRSPDGWTARGDAQLVVSAGDGGLQVGGAVDLDQVLYVEDVKLGLEQLLTGLFSSERLEVTPAEGWRAATHLNLRIAGDRALRVRNNVADLRGSADLVLRGTLARPVLFGTVEVEPGGRLDYGGADYKIERGQLAFTNPYRIEPAIDLSARAELREYDITLNLAGTPDRLELDFASNPPLADLDVLSLLSGSPERAVAAAGSSRGDSVSAESFLYGQATSLIAQRFNRLFGLDKFRIDPLTSATGDLSSARVTIGKRLTRNLSVTYSYDPSTSEEQVLELDWNVTRNLILVLTQNGDGTYAVDALWERAF